MKKILLSIVCAILLSVSLTACEFFGTELTFDTVKYEDYDPGFSYLSKEIIKENNYDSDIPNEVRDVDLELDEDYDVTYEKVKASASYEELCAMGANDDLLYPGALVDVKDGIYRPIYVDRSPITISANLEAMMNTTSKLSTTIQEPNLSSVRTGIREIISDNIKGDGVQLPSNIFVDIHEVNNKDEFLMNLGFGLQFKKFNLSENFSYEKINKQTNLVIVLKQVYYTVDMDYNGVDGFFSEKVLDNEIKRKLSGTIPAYVSSVSYGRIAMISIQTNYSKEEIINALNASWGKKSENPGGSALKKLSIEFDTTLKNISADTDTKINYFVYGGGSSTNNSITPITSNSVEMISEIFESFNTMESVGLPISYKLRLLNGQLHKIQDASEYVIKNVRYNPKKIMDWSYMNQLLQDREIAKMETLKIDLSGLVDYYDIENTDVNAQRTVIIPRSIKDLYLIGPNDSTDQISYKDLSLRIGDRTEPLTIHFLNITFSGDTKNTNTNGVAIISDQYAPLILDIQGDVSISGNGGEAIIAKNLKISGSGTLKVYGGVNHAAIICEQVLTINTINPISIYGGNGSDGKYWGESGSDGAVGVVAHQICINTNGKVNIFGGNGGKGAQGVTGEAGRTDVNITVGKQGDQNYGKQGGHGGKGGDGGRPIDVNSIIYASQELPNVFVQYGNGGDGGKGGTGGTGGNYYNAIGTVWRCGGGSGGQGGDGGKGHKGGKGGDGGDVGQPGSNNSVNGIALGINYGVIYYDYENNAISGNSGDDGTTLVFTIV